MLTRWQVYQIVTSSKVLGSPSVESTWTLFVLRLMQTQSKAIDKEFKINKRAIKHLKDSL